jgi:cadmium resistance protein CadD (predicted permease)
MANKDKDMSTLMKVLAFCFVGSVGLTVLAVILILLAAFSNNAWIPNGLGLIPMLAMPFGFLCLVGVLILNARDKKKESK